MSAIEKSELDRALSIVEQARAALAATDFGAALERDVEALSQKRFVSAMEAGLIAGRHPETIREAARKGELHGMQREGVNPRTNKSFRGAQWRFRPACVEAWVDGVPCEHQDEARRPVSLSEFRMRAVGGQR